MRKRNKRLIIFLGYLEALGLSLVLYLAFLIAYTNPTRKVTLDINHIGEANLEYVLIPLVILISIYGLKLLLDEWGERND